MELYIVVVQSPHRLTYTCKVFQNMSHLRIQRRDSTSQFFKLILSASVLCFCLKSICNAWFIRTRYTWVNIEHMGQHCTRGSTLYKWVNIVHMGQHCTRGSTLYKWVNIVHVCQHCTRGSTVYTWVNIVYMGRHYTRGSTLYKWVNIGKLFAPCESIFDSISN